MNPDRTYTRKQPGKSHHNAQDELLDLLAGTAAQKKPS
jgi:hypothetical protein